MIPKGSYNTLPLTLNRNSYQVNFSFCGLSLPNRHFQLLFLVKDYVYGGCPVPILHLLSDQVKQSF